MYQKKHKSVHFAKNCIIKESLKIPMGQSISINWRRSDITMAKRKGQKTIYKRTYR